jgi:hypothetical protein
MQDEAIAVVKQVESWAEKIGAKPKFKTDQDVVLEVLSTKPSELEKKTKSELMDFQHILTCDISNLNCITNELNCIMYYCDSNINYITCDKVRNMQDMMKNDTKVLVAIKKDAVCSSLLKLKNKTKLKLIELENCITIRQKFLDIIDLIVKGKIYDRGN